MMFTNSYLIMFCRYYKQTIVNKEVTDSLHKGQDVDFQIHDSLIPNQ